MLLWLLPVQFFKVYRKSSCSNSNWNLKIAYRYCTTTNTCNHPLNAELSTNLYRYCTLFFLLLTAFILTTVTSMNSKIGETSIIAFLIRLSGDKKINQFYQYCWFFITIFYFDKMIKKKKKKRKMKFSLFHQHIRITYSEKHSVFL